MLFHNLFIRNELEQVYFISSYIQQAKLSTFMRKAKIHPSKFLNPQIFNASMADLTTSSTRLTQCKICKSDNFVNDLIQPCQCQQPVHQSCLQQYLNVKLKSAKDIEQDSVQQFACEKCFQRIYYKVGKAWQCKTCDQICQIISKRPCYFIINLFFMIIAIGLLSIAIVLKISPSVFTFLQNSTISLIVNVGFFVLGSVLLLITIYNLSIDFTIISRLSVAKIMSQKIQKRKKSHRKSECQIQILQ